ncbi:MAG: TetR/AcrR family transcriptional regulator [Methyloversatilis sp.]|uniref:TetR/AcrR family transcriptional regulator n=1 Tax=Methyloversatilis sp. TaxID=2569862 RepID=UPI002735D44A|nr:TetR/AcrR family transcriptional regulator [Methyloversatilis sp.]MDP3872953.1 TetR/AcrR family transcriptional regulator [Methyloversatilis sp.]
MVKSTVRSPDDEPVLPAPNAPRVLREAAINETRRMLILDAARSAFFELGLEGASLREIAKRAGYTPGALYSYFGSREEIYAALLGESLQRLKQCVDDATPAGGVAATDERAALVALLRARAIAFFGFYRDHPQDMDLGFYLFNGARPRGLTPELNQQLNGRLQAALLPIQELLVQLGLNEAEAVIETSAIFAHIVGLLMLNNTGRIRLFGQNAHDLLVRYLDPLSARFAGPA